MTLFKRCPKCRGYMTPDLSYTMMIWKCMCGYTTAGEQQTYATGTSGKFNTTENLSEYNRGWDDCEKYMNAMRTEEERHK
jgi:hypothetical protein